jgi:hypothetical protein
MRNRALLWHDAIDAHRDQFAIAAQDRCAKRAALAQLDIAGQANGEAPCCIVIRVSP